jgi:hypothetical protein
MRNEQNKTTEIISTVPVYSDLHQMKHLNSNHLIETILVVFALLNCLKKLWLSIDKLRKQGKCSPKLLLQIVGALWAIVKVIAQIKANQDDAE